MILAGPAVRRLEQRLDAALKTLAVVEEDECKRTTEVPPRFRGLRSTGRGGPPQASGPRGFPNLSFWAAAFLAPREAASSPREAACGSRISWDLKTQQTNFFIDCKSKDINRLLFQIRTNVSLVSTFRFHAISVWKRKPIDRASRHQIPLPSVQRSASIFGTKCLVFQFLKTAHCSHFT